MIKSIKSFFGSFLTYFIEIKLEEKFRILLVALAAWQISFPILGITQDNFMCRDMWRNIEWWRYLLAVIVAIVFLLFLFSNTIEEKRKEWVMRRRHLTGTIISKRISKLEFMDAQGKKVRYFEKVHISKFDSNTPLVTTIVTDDNIDDSRFDLESIQLNHCSFQSLKGNKVIKIRIENFNQKPKNSPLKVDDFCCYSVDFINSFVNKKGDSWEIDIDNYTKEYVMKIIFPSAKKIKSVVLYKKQKIKEENETKEKENLEENGATPIILHGVNENSIFLNLINLDRKTTYILRWLYN